MSDTNSFTFLMLPPQTALTRQWAKRLTDTVAGMKLVVAESADEAATAIVTGTMATCSRHGSYFTQYLGHPEL